MYAQSNIPHLTSLNISILLYTHTHTSHETTFNLIRSTLCTVKTITSSECATLFLYTCVVVPPSLRPIIPFPAPASQPTC